MFFIKKINFTIFLFIILIVIGIVSLIKIPKELFPEVNVPILVVSTSYPGASAEDIEISVTNVLEKKLIGSINNSKKITSDSKQNSSSIVIELKEGSDIDKTKEEINDILKKNKGDLPKDALSPNVFKVEFSNEPVYIFALSTNEAFNNLFHLTNELKNDIKKINGVSDVSVSGIGKREISILLDDKKLSLNDISVNEISAALTQAKNVFPVGNINFNKRNLSILYESQIKDVNSLEELIIKKENNSFLRLKDLAVRIEDGLSKKTSLSRVSTKNLDKQQSVIFSVTKKSGGNIISLTEKIKEELKKFNKKKGGNLKFIDIIDSGNDIEEQLSELVLSGLQTIIIVILVVMFFIGAKGAIISALSVPFTFLISFIIMEYLDQTINFMSLFSLILVIGILIDSTIVIVEAIVRENKKEKEIKKSCISVISEFSKPVISGTLTTIAVFVPLLTISGITGQFIGSIPKTVVIVLFSSLFTALVFVPIIFIILNNIKIKENKFFKNKSKIFFKKIEIWYESKLVKMLDSQKVRKKIRRTNFLLFIFTILLVIFGLIKFSFFPEDNYDRIFIDFKNKVNTDLSTTSENIKEIENILLKNKHIDSFSTTIGSSSPFSKSNSSVSSEELASINIKISDKTYGNEVFLYLKENLKPFFKNYNIDIIKPSSGPPVGSAIEINLFSENIDDLEKYSQKIFNILQNIPGVENPNVGFELGAKKLSLIPKENKIIEYQLSNSFLSSFLRSNVFGIKSTSINLKEGSVDVIIKTAINVDTKKNIESNNVKIDSLKKIIVKTPKGNVTLDTLVDFRIKQDRTKISHKEGKKNITVTAGVSKGFYSSDIEEEINKEIEKINFNTKNDIIIKIGGEAKASSEANSDLLISLVYGLLLMTLVLMWQFNSFKSTYFILSVIPAGLSGVLLGLFLTSKDLSFTSMLGFIALVGIIVNNSIILIDTFNNLQKKGKYNLGEVVMKGSILRLKPILVTTCTTVLGVIPLVFVSPTWAPFAIALIFGLIFATFITLFIIPMKYYRSNKKNNFL